jgi:hypothetical protein
MRIGIIILSLNLAFLTGSCSVTVPELPDSPSVKLSQAELKAFNQEYYFSEKALTQSYLERKLRKWLGLNSPKLVKEIEYCRFKGESDIPFKALMITDPDLYNSLTANTLVIQAISNGNVPLGVFLEQANPNPPLPSDVIFVKATANGANNGTSWTDAYTTIQPAIDAAFASTDKKNVWVSVGTYKPGTLRSDSFQMKNGVKIYGGFAGTEMQFSQRNLSAGYETILSGDLNESNSANSGDSFHIVRGASGATLDGVTIKYGYADGSPPGGYDYVGAGLFNDNSSSPVIANVIFTENTALDYGAGIYNANGSSPTVNNVVFYKNTAYNGAGMFSWYNSAPVVTNSTFAYNTGTVGGGMAVYYSIPGGTLKNCIFYGNANENIRVVENSTLKVSFSNIEGGLPGIILGTNSTVHSPDDQVISDNNGYTAAGNIAADPLFKSPLDLDGADNILRTVDDGLALQKSPLISPAIDSGSSEGTSKDLTGHARPVIITNPQSGSGYDMGAYESL